MGHDPTRGGHHGHLRPPGAEVDGQDTVLPAAPLRRAHALTTQIVAMRTLPPVSSSTTVPSLPPGGGPIDTDRARTSRPIDPKNGSRLSRPSRYKWIQSETSRPDALRRSWTLRMTSRTNPRR